MKSNQSTQNERRILLLSFIAGLLFVIVELISSVYTHSQSVLMDAAYDASELVMIVFVLFLTPLFHKPVSEKHPYGFSQVESIVVIVKGCMMLSVTVGLSINNLNLALSGGNPVDGSQISLLQFLLGLASLIVFLIMMGLNRSVSSPTVKAELLGWKLDIAYSAGLSLAFFLSTFLDETPLASIAPYFDQLVAVLVILCMLPENLKLLWRAVKDVFLFSPEDSIVEEIKADVNHALAESEFEPVFYDITRTGRYLWVAVYFTIDGPTLSMEKLQRATEKMHRILDPRFPNCRSELIPLPKDKLPFPAEIEETDETE